MQPTDSGSAEPTNKQDFVNISQLKREQRYNSHPGISVLMGEHFLASLATVFCSSLQT